MARASGRKVKINIGNSVEDYLLQAFEAHNATIDKAIRRLGVDLASMREDLAVIRDDNGGLMDGKATIEDRLNTMKEKLRSDDGGSP